MAIGILMAAGLGTRMRPLTEKTPKPMVQVGGKPMIETVIEGLKNCGVEKIYIIVGYLKEQFGELKDKYADIIFIENTEYREKNNISSIHAARDILGTDDCFICEADLYISDASIFNLAHRKSCYYGKFVEGFSDDWVFEQDESGRITRVGKGGTDCYNMVGISFFKKEDADILKKAVEQTYQKQEESDLFWDDVVNAHLDYLDLGIYSVDGKQIAEIDTCEELEEIEKCLKNGLSIGGGIENSASSNNWRKIWEKRDFNLKHLLGLNKQGTFLELKRLAGFDVVDGAMDYDSFYGQYLDTKKYLITETEQRVKCQVKSIYEVGCGSGANLYLFEDDGFTVGGTDYSENLIHAAEAVLKESDLHYERADEIDTEKQYDVCLANSVFSYFTDTGYAEKVLERMYKKAHYAVGLIDLHDRDKKEDFIKFRKEEIPDYEERYQDLPKFFYEKAFFIKFADEHDMDILFTESYVKGYWNNPFVFNVFLYKR